MNQDNKNIIEVLELSQEMLKLAQKGDAERKDKSCGVVFGVLRDAGYKLDSLARQEVDLHRQKGWWDADTDEV